MHEFNGFFGKHFRYFKPFVAILTHANRGNVAVICWNTLNTNTWYVSSEKLDGEVTLGVGEEAKTLLAINFNDFTTKNGDLKEIEEVVISKVDDRQIILNAEDVEFADEFEKEPKKDGDDKSYKTTTENDDDETVLDEVYIYVPEEVCEDLDSLKNKSLTIILGEDDVAALIIVEENVVETAFLTDYDGDDKITVAGKDYKIVDEYKVVVNDIEYKKGNTATGYETLREALNKILDDSVDVGEAFEDIEKKIEATLTLNSKGKVETIELFASSNELDNTIETLVEEVKEGKNKYTIYVTNSADKIVVEDDYDDLPKVYIDGKKGDLSDIEAGNVLTIITTDDSDSKSDVKIGEEKISKIYVSTEIVNGEPNRVKKSNSAIKVEGTEYIPSEKISSIYTEELEKDAKTTGFSADTIMDNDTVTLYLNIFGEYVAVSVEDGTTSDYQFGVITYVDDDVDYEGDDGEIETMAMKLLAQDATKSVRYTVKADTSDDDIDEGDLATKLTDVEYKLVMFIADANRNIDYEDLHIISDARTAETIDDLKDYTFFETTTVDGKKVVDESNGNAKYRYSAADTVIFNTGAEEICGAVDGGSHKDGCSRSSAKLTDIACTGKVKFDAEVISNWSNILTDDTTLQNNAICVLDKDDDLVCISLLVDSDGSSDTEYAVVVEEIYTYKDDTYAKLLSENETLTLKANEADDDEIVLGGFVSYKAPSDKIKTPTLLLDVVEFNKLLTKDDKPLATSSTESAILPTIPSELKKSDKYAYAENFEVEKIYFDKDADTEYEIEYIEITSPEDNQIDQVGSIDIADKNTTVYDLRDGKCEEITMKALKDIVDAEETVYVIRVAGTDDAKDDDVLVVLGE